jgi:hypothetical protein
MNKCYLVLILLFLSIIPLCGQDFKVNRVEVAAGKVNIYYDLIDTTARGYTINVYASRDNFIAPLKKVTGDAGLEVKAGKGKKIVWDAPAELGPDFDGKMALEVRGRVYIPFVRFERFEEYKAIKRGKPYNISWTGGTQQNILNFEMYKGEKKVTTFTDVANTGKYKLTLPTSVKPGKNYKFKISDTKNKDEVIYTGNFAVKRKVPLLVKAIPIVALGALVYLLTIGEEGDEKIPDPVNPK